MRKPLLVVVAGAVCAMALVPALSRAQVGTPFDHLKCYRIKDPLKAKYLADLVPLQKPQFQDELGCIIGLPAKMFCVPVQKLHVQPPPAGTVNGINAQDYLLYKIKCPKQALSSTPLQVADQFGTRAVFVGKHQLLLVPAFKQNNLCHNQADPGLPPVCGGDCVNPNQKCVQIPGTIDCGCDSPCGIDAAGTCAGTCPFPGQDCHLAPLSTGVLGCTCEPFEPGCVPEPATGQCAGPCPTADETCITDATTGSCRCVKPCGPTGIHQCGGLCPNATDTCVVMSNDAGCECRPAGPTPCGLISPGQCGGVCPNNTVCLPVGPVPANQCACGIPNQ